MAYPEAVWERAMTVQEVMLRDGPPLARAQPAAAQERPAVGRGRA